jgi:LPS export ABC transporter protein LptC
MNKPVFLLLFILAACSQKENTQPKEYEGPLQEAEQVELLYTENEKLKVKMRTPLLYEFKNGDREFPKGVNLEFYDVTGTLASTMRSDHAYYFKNEDKWRARGKVEVVNIEKNEQLSTEELFWFPVKETITTEKFVTIRMQKEVIFGNGLNARQDMSSYEITDPHGSFSVDDQ